MRRYQEVIGEEKQDRLDDEFNEIQKRTIAKLAEETSNDTQQSARDQSNQRHPPMIRVEESEDDSDDHR